ncbi:MAG: ribosome maturation factor RimM [Clostridiales bacterium]|jgi:16S rRNA processing protein RimM|nr:ribosome maturation factor RimM [Clostridiales bacterium]
MLNPLIKIGVVTKSYGNFGKLKIKVWFENIDIIKNLKYVYLKSMKFNVESSRIQKNNIIFKLKEINNSNEIPPLIGETVKINRSQISNSENFYNSDLINFKVKTQNEKILGRISEIIKTGANDVYVIIPEINSNNSIKIKKTKKLKEILIPVIDEVMQSINFKDKIITVKLLKGLIDDEV